MKYNVHVYVTVRVRVLDVEATSQDEAIKRVRDHVNLNNDLMNRSHPLSNVEDVEFVDEITGYLVDEQGDEEHERSRFYKTRTGN